MKGVVGSRRDQDTWTLEQCFKENFEDNDSSSLGNIYEMEMMFNFLENDNIRIFLLVLRKIVTE